MTHRVWSQPSDASYHAVEARLRSYAADVEAQRQREKAAADAHPPCLSTAHRAGLACFGLGAAHRIDPGLKVLGAALSVLARARLIAPK